jgi:hypothetical protein
MFFENDKKRALEFVERVIRERRRPFLEYLMKAIEIKREYPKEQYLDKLKALEAQYKFPHEIVRKMNLAIFTSEVYEVKNLKEKIQVALKFIERGSRNER